MNSLWKINRWLETLRSMWAFAVFLYRTFIAPWPPFTIFVTASALVAVVTPTVIVRATSGLIDAITRAVGSSPSEASLIELLDPVIPRLALLLTVRAADSVIQMDAPFLFLARKLGLHSMAKLEGHLYGKAVSLRLEWFEYPRYYDGLQRDMDHRGPMDEMEQSWNLLKMQNVLMIAFQTVGILVALAALHWSVPVAMLAVNAVLLLSHGIQVRRSVDVYRSQTTARRRQEYWRKLLTERSPAPEVRLFGLAGHLRGSWRSTTDEILREKTALRLKNLSFCRSILADSSRSVRDSVHIADMGGERGSRDSRRDHRLCLHNLDLRRQSLRSPLASPFASGVRGQAAVPSGVLWSRADRATRRRVLANQYARGRCAPLCILHISR